jgi:hypothetical protein
LDKKGLAFFDAIPLSLFATLTDGSGCGHRPIAVAAGFVRSLCRICAHRQMRPLRELGENQIELAAALCSQPLQTGRVLVIGR